MIIKGKTKLLLKIKSKKIRHRMSQKHYDLGNVLTECTTRKPMISRSKTIKLVRRSTQRQEPKKIQYD